MYSAHGDLKEAGFPHSEICGSAPICRLPAAYRRLSRPSSPIIAKASTTCTYSLDPITLLPLPGRYEPKSLAPSQDHRQLSRLCIPTLSGEDTMQYITQCPHYSRLITRHFRENNYLLFQIVKERFGSGGSGWIRTIDPRLIKTVL